MNQEIYQTILNVLETQITKQWNLDSESGREHVAKLITTELEHLSCGTTES